LRSFTNSEGYLIPYYKADHAIIGKPKLPKTVCYEVDGDSNKYFSDPRVLDSYLPQFENPWQQNVQALRRQSLDDIVKYQIAGYVAFSRTCTPTAKRMGKEMLEAVVQPTFDSIAERFFKEHPPESSKAMDLIGRALKQKEIRVDVDRQFPHALGISSLVQSIERYFHGNWLVMINEGSRPFITSDNPAVAYYHTRDHSIAQIYVPLAPDIAILIAAALEDRPIQFPIRRGTLTSINRFASPKLEYVDTFNELIIKAAELRVFSDRVGSWIEESVRKHKDWRMETVVDELPNDRGSIIVTRQLVRRRERA
jgi:hypothetical protein